MNSANNSETSLTPGATGGAGLLCIGHRGASGHAPENTLLSVRRALELGADAIEIDARLVHGHLLVIHDNRLERTTNGTGALTDHSFESLRSLDAGRGEQIPILEEVVELVAHRVQLVIELKGLRTAEPVVNLLGRYLGSSGWRPEDFLVSSFDHDELRKARALAPSIPRGPLIAGVPLGYARFAEALAAHSVHVSKEFLRPAFVADAHRRGLKVFVFTVNEAEEIARMRALGVDGVFTDFPDRVVADRSGFG